MSLTSSATLVVPEGRMPTRGHERVPRCQVLDIHPRRGTNRCSDEAVDEAGEVLICARHLALVLELAGHLPGIEISLTGVPA